MCRSLGLVFLQRILGQWIRLVPYYYKGPGPLSLLSQSVRTQSRPTHFISGFWYGFSISICFWNPTTLWRVVNRRFNFFSIWVRCELGCICLNYHYTPIRVTNSCLLLTRDPYNSIGCGVELIIGGGGGLRALGIEPVQWEGWEPYDSLPPGYRAM